MRCAQFWGCCWLFLPSFTGPSAPASDSAEQERGLGFLEGPRLLLKGLLILAAAGADGICRNPQLHLFTVDTMSPRSRAQLNAMASPALSAGGEEQVGQSSKIRKQAVKASFSRKWQKTLFTTWNMPVVEPKAQQGHLLNRPGCPLSSLIFLLSCPWLWLHWRSQSWLQRATFYLVGGAGTAAFVTSEAWITQFLKSSYLPAYAKNI